MVDYQRKLQAFRASEQTAEKAAQVPASGATPDPSVT